MRAKPFSGLAYTSFLLLSACGADDASPARSSTGDEKVLNVYNWTDYIGRSTIADFETRTGIKVHYDTYDSNELLETKLLIGQSGYDVVFPTATVLGRLARVGVFQKLERSRLPNFSNLNPEILERVAKFDPGNEHSIPYMWGTTGIGYNPELVRKALGTDIIDSWSAIFDPATASKLAKCGITILDSPEDAFESAEAYLGTATNNENPAELAAAESLLMGVRAYVRSFDSTQHLNALAAGDICVSLSWSGLMLQARARGAKAAVPVRIAYVIPKEGAPLWFDTVAIPADAPHLHNAHAFLNFLMDPKVIAGISNDIEYANANAASLAFVEPTLKGDPAAYPPLEVMPKLHVSAPRSQAYSRETNRAWTRVKTGH